MANTIKIKRKTTAGPPLIGDLVDGEMCLVVPDQTLYMRVDASNLIVVNSGAVGSDFLMATFDIVDPSFVSGSTVRSVCIPAPGVGKGIIINGINSFTVSPITSVGGVGNPSLAFYYGGDGGYIDAGIPFLQGTNNNTIWSSSAAGNRYLNINNVEIQFRLIWGTVTETVSGTIRVWVKYSIVDL